MNNPVFCLQMQRRIAKERNPQLNCHENVGSRLIYSNFNKTFSFCETLIFTTRKPEFSQNTMWGTLLCVDNMMIDTTLQQAQTTFSSLYINYQLDTLIIIYS